MHIHNSYFYVVKHSITQTKHIKVLADSGRLFEHNGFVRIKEQYFILHKKYVMYLNYPGRGLLQSKFQIWQ